MFVHPALVGPQAGPTSNHTPEYNISDGSQEYPPPWNTAQGWHVLKEKHNKTHSPDALADSVEEVDIQFLCLQVQEYN